MSKTYRHNKNLSDGEPYRGCGERNCPYCVSNRQNVKLKVRETLIDLEGITL